MLHGPGGRGCGAPTLLDVALLDSKFYPMSLSENTPKRCGRGDLAPTLTKIKWSRIVQNALYILVVKVGAGFPRPS